MNGVPGHGFQYKIEDRVKECGFKTFPEQSYIDDVEHKPRSIDFVATQERVSYNRRGNQLALVVECKYLTEDVHCYIRPNPKDKNAYFIDGYLKEDLLRIHVAKFHYLNSDTVIVNIDQNKKADLYGAVHQAYKALLYLRGSQRILDKKGLFYSIVVYGGKGKILDQDNTEIKNALNGSSHIARKRPQREVST